MIVVALYVNLLQTICIATRHIERIVLGKRKGKQNTEKVQNNQTFIVVL